MSFPVFVADGTKAQGTTGEVSVPLPAGIEIDDIIVLIATTIAGGTISITASGGFVWTAFNDTPVNVALGEKLYAWWARRVTGAETAPKVQAGTDHVCAGTTAWRGCEKNGSPINVSAVGTEAVVDNSFQFITGISTTENECICVCIVTNGTDSSSSQTSNMANNSLTDITELQDYNTSNGGGGGFGMSGGKREQAGSVGTFMGNLATASTKAFLGFALKPVFIPVALPGIPGLRTGVLLHLCRIMRHRDPAFVYHGPEDLMKRLHRK